MTEKPLNLFFSVGEESADLHASSLCRALRERRPNLRMFGLGGDKMQAEGVEILYPLPKLALIGFVEVIKHLPEIYRVRALALQAWRERRPDAVVLVDYPGFNLRLARLAHRMNIPVLYYIAPQVWAWKEKRAEQMRETIDRLFVIFPFEEPYFQNHRIHAAYVGHPLAERISPAAPAAEPVEERLRRPLIGLMPGSRRTELRHMLPTLLQAASILKERHPDFRFQLPLADALPESVLAEFSVPDWVDVVRDAGYEKRRQMTLAWTASGTATVENALLGIPMAVVFRTGAVNMFLGRRLVRIPYIGMVNLIARKGICPEFIQEQLQPRNLVRFTEELLASPDRYREMLDDLARVRAQMGEQPASERAAEAMLAFLDASEPPDRPPTPSP